MIHIDKGKIEINGNGITILTELAVARKVVLDMLPAELREQAEDLLKGAEKAAEMLGEERMVS